MAINSIDVNNVLVFQCKEDSRNSPLSGFHLEFCNGINVLIGENGVGKTSLLKMIYAASQWSRGEISFQKPIRLLNYFSNGLKDEDAMRNNQGTHGGCSYKVVCGQSAFEYFPKSGSGLEEIIHSTDWTTLSTSSVYIPTTEMLSHAKGFLALNEKYKMPFDQTQVDIIVNASLPETKEITPVMKKVLEKLSDVIDGTVIQSEDVFYIVKKDGRKIDFSLEAEGYRKLGLLWKLIRNGLLESGAILLWDEPEANLNPELYPLVADIFLELANNGVQIFAATHSYNFAKYLEIRRTTVESVVFHNLFWRRDVNSDTDEGTFPEKDESKTVCSDSSNYLEKLSPNHIMIADNRLLDEIYNL